MADRGIEFSFFRSIHVRIDLKIYVSISIKPMTTKFSNQEFTGVGSNKINHAGVGNVITSRLRGKLN